MTAITFHAPSCGREDCDHGWDCEQPSPRRPDVAIQVPRTQTPPFEVIASPGRLEAWTVTVDGRPDTLLASAKWVDTHWEVRREPQGTTVVHVGSEVLARCQLESYAEQALTGGAA